MSPTSLKLRFSLILSGLTIASASLLAQGFPGGGGFGGGRGGFGGPGGRGGPGGMFGAEQELVDQFDKNDDGWLNLEERDAAYQSLQANGGGGGGFGGRGGRGGRGGPGGQMGGTAQPGIKLAPADVKSGGDAPIYDLGTLRTFFLEFEESDWEAKMAAFKNTDIEVPAEVTVDGKVYPGVGVHFRGASSFSFVSDGFKRSLNLSFDFLDEDQDLGGYRTFNLLNSNGDPTFMRAVLYTQIAREYIPAAKTNFVRVVINGEDWGIYQNIQQYNKDMVDEWFGTKKGARWKVPGSPNGQGTLAYLGDNPESYKGIYEIKTKDDDEDWNAFISFLKILNQTPPSQLEQALEPVLDVDGALKFLALDNALLNEDGYWTRASDYNIYRDENGRFHIIPHDANETFLSLNGGGPGGRGGPGGFGGFGGFGGGSNGVSLSPLVNENDSSRALASRLLAVPALKERYLGYVEDIATKWLDWDRLGPLVQKNRELIAEVVAQDTKKLSTTEEFLAGTADEATRDSGVISLRNFADGRRAYLLDFLANR